MEDRGGVMETPDRLLTSPDQLLEARDQFDSITINIRSPVSTIEDLRVVCPQDWRVLRLKEEIAKLFPGNPSPKSQKLVYAGKMLEDGDRLKQFIRFQDECAVYTIHLVCKVNQVGGDAPQLRQRRPEATPAASPQLPTNIFHQDVNSWAQYMQLSEQTQFTEDNLQQMAVMQEMYSQYLSQYMQYMQTGSVVPQPEMAAVLHEEAHEVARVPVVMNAGGGGAQAFQDEDDQGNRDMLDWLYVSIRVLILLSIVYFYSSLSRFVLVAAIFLVLYSFQVGFWPVNNRDRDNIQQEVNNIRDQQQQQQQPDQQQQDPVEAGAEEAAAPEERVEPPAPNLVDVVYTFLTTFFTSIIPEQIQLI